MSRTIGIFTESSDRNPEIDLCRLCREKHDCFYSIFTSNVAYNITVKDALHDLVGLQITVGDGLPTTMCPLCLKKLTEFSVFKKICLESDAVLRKSCFRPNTLTASQGEKVEAQSRGNIVADLDLTLFGAKKELSPEENAQALKGGADTDVSEGDLPEDQQSEEYDEESFCLRLESDSDEGDECSDAGTKVPTLSEDGDPFESSATAYESAIGVPAAEAMLEQTSTPYVLAEGSTRNHSIDECIGPKPKATQVVSKAGTSHEEIGKNLIDEDLKKCGASETDEISSCSIPDDRQCNNKDIESLTSSRVGAAMAVVGEKSGCDAPNTSHNHRFIRISRNDRSDCETIVGGNNEVLNCLIENPGNSYSSNEDSYNCVNCRDVFNNKKELMKHMKIHFAARKFDAAAESSIVDVSLEALPSSGHSSSCEPTTSKALSGQERKRLKPIQKENVLIKETSGGKGDEKNIRRLTISFTVGEKSATQRLSSKSSSIRNLRNHLGPRKEERLYSCTVCNESFTQKRDLTVHKSTHTGGKRYSCGTCSKSFTHRGHLDIHSRTHAVEKPFTCKVCSESFPRKNILNAHVRRHTGERPFSCDVCEKSFSVKGNLVRHVRRHAGEKLFSCNECEKSFLWKSDLVRHVHTHTGGKIFPCRICDKSFTEKSVLRRHIRIHTGEKPFICKVCSKSFSRKDNLDAHARTHTGEKPYSCNECEKSFSVKGNLVRHVRTHTGEKPFSCNDCEKSFTDKSTLVIHVRTHTGEKNFSCRICDKSFARKSVLKRHSRTHGREAFFMQ